MTIQQAMNQTLMGTALATQFGLKNIPALEERKERLENQRAYQKHKVGIQQREEATAGEWQKKDYEREIRYLEREIEKPQTKEVLEELIKRRGELKEEYSGIEENETIEEASDNQPSTDTQTEEMTEEVLGEELPLPEPLVKLNAEISNRRNQQVGLEDRFQALGRSARELNEEGIISNKMRKHIEYELHKRGGNQ